MVLMHLKICCVEVIESSVVICFFSFHITTSFIRKPSRGEMLAQGSTLVWILNEESNFCSTVSVTFFPLLIARVPSFVYRLSGVVSTSFIRGRSVEGLGIRRKKYCLIWGRGYQLNVRPAGITVVSRCYDGTPVSHFAGNTP